MIASYLAGNCTSGEKALVEQWVSASVKNAELFNQYKAVWKFTAPPVEVPEFNQSEALASVRNRINRLQNPGLEIFAGKSRSKTYRVLYRYAAGVAAVMLVALASYMLLRVETNVQMNSVTAEQRMPEPVVLPDGSKVYLNKGATLDFPEKFDNKQRQVTLTGEAFFEVEHGNDWPFVVVTGNLGVKVLGTSFNVNACNQFSTVEVSIQTGKVLFYSFEESSGDVLEQIILNQGEKGIYYKTNGLIARSQLENNNCLSWKSGLLEFSNTPLTEVINALERTYDLQFTCDRDFSHLALTARFAQEEPQNILETLRVIFGFRIEQNGNQVRIF